MRIRAGFLLLLLIYLACDTRSPCPMVVPSEHDFGRVMVINRLTGAEEAREGLKRGQDYLRGDKDFNAARERMLREYPNPDEHVGMEVSSAEGRPHAIWIINHGGRVDVVTYGQEYDAWGLDELPWSVIRSRILTVMRDHPVSVVDLSATHGAVYYVVACVNGQQVGFSYFGSAEVKGIEATRPSLDMIQGIYDTLRWRPSIN